MKVLAFDLGASSGKLYAASFENHKIRLEEIHRFPNHGISMGPGIYWDFPSIYSNLILGVQKAQALYPGEICSLGIDSFSNDFGLLQRNGELLTPIRCYRDERTLRYKNELDTIMPPYIRHQLSGCQNSPATTLMHLGAMQLSGQGNLLNMAHRLLMVPDLIVYFLTGIMKSEYTISSVSQMYDYGSGQWNRKILNAYHIPESLLAPIIPPGTRIGGLSPRLMEEHHLSPMEVISVCEHDTASAYAAAPCLPNSAVISTGTWCLAGLETEAPIINRSTFLANLSNEGGYPGPHHRLLKCVMGLWLLQEVRTYYVSLGQDYTFAELDALAKNAEPFAYYIDPDQEIFFSQGNMPKRIQDACMKLYGSFPRTPGEIVRCILESLAFKFRWTIDQLEAVSEKPLYNIQLIGGGCQDHLFARFIANACRRTVHCGPTDAAALGNALVQFISHGAISDLEHGRAILQGSCSICSFAPRDQAVWEKEYQKFKSLFSL